MQTYFKTSTKQNGLMAWTTPNTPAHTRYYSKFSGVLKALTISRRLVQYGIWWIVAAGAMAYLVKEATVRFIALPPVLLWAVCLVVAALLHRLFSETTRAHYFDKWDNDPDTNSTLLAPILIGLFLVGLEYNSLSGYFIEKLETPVTITDTSEGDYNTATATITANYEAEKARIEESYNDRAALLAPTLSNQLDGYKKQLKRAKDTTDRDYLKAMVAKTERAIEANPKLKDLRTATDGQLSTLLLDHQTETARLRANRDKSSMTVAGKNFVAVTDHQADKRQAKGMAGAISAFCFLFTLFCLRAEVRIKTKAGIFPVREFTDLESHGGPMEKAGHVLSDVFNRRFHQLIYGYHRRAVRSMDGLETLDGSLEVKPGDYSRKNGHKLHFDETPGKS